MNKTDKYIITSAITLIALLISVYLKKSAIFCCFLCSATAICTYVFMLIIQNSSAHTTFSEFRLYYSVVGNKELSDIATAFISDVYKNQENSINMLPTPIVSVKSGGITRSDLCSYINEALKKDNKALFFICERLPADSVKISKAFGLDVMFISLKRFYRYIKRNDLLPKVDKHRRFERFSKKANPLYSAGLNGKKLKNSLASILTKDGKHEFFALSEQILSRKNAVRFFLCAIILSLLFFITPFKIYYLILTGILLSFCVICLLKNAVF